MGSPHFRCNDLVTLSCGTLWGISSILRAHAALPFHGPVVGCLRPDGGNRPADFRGQARTRVDARAPDRVAAALPEHAVARVGAGPLRLATRSDQLLRAHGHPGSRPVGGGSGAYPAHL